MGKDKVKKPFYKKWWVWLIAVIVVIGFASGGEEDAELVNSSKPASGEVKSDDATSEKPKEEPKKEVKTSFKVGDTIEMNGLQITIKSVKFTPPNQYVKAEKGQVVTLEVAAKNASDKDIFFSDMEFNIADSQGNQYENYFAYDDTGFTEELKPGNQMTGKLAFDVAQAEGYTIYYEPSFEWDAETIEIKVSAAEMK